MITDSVFKTHEAVLDRLQVQGVIPAFYHTDVHTLLYVLQIAYRCGARTFEFVHHRDSRSLQFFSMLITEAATMPGMHVGVGAVLDPITARSYIKAGAAFVASPFIQEQTASYCQDKQVLWIPGCTHLQDIEAAMKLGAEAVTVLPVSGPGVLLMKQMRVAYPSVALIPSIGIRMEENTLSQWFDAGALSIRLGDVLFPKESIAIRDWTKIEHRVYHTLQMVKQIKLDIKQHHLQSIL